MGIQPIASLAAGLVVQTVGSAMLPLVRAVVASCLVLEAVLAASWVARIFPALPGYGSVALTMVAARLAMTALQTAAVVGLVQQNPNGPRLAAMAFIGSAGLLTLELGARLIPTNVFPSHRWPLIGLYLGYAAGGLLLSRRLQTN